MGSVVEYMEYGIESGATSTECHKPVLLHEIGPTAQLDNAR